MQTAAVQADPAVVRAFLDEYFGAWRGTDVAKILTYYSDDVVLHIPMGRLDGKAAVRDTFVRPIVEGFPGNLHVVQNLIYGVNVVTVEWSFEAVHTGPFANVPASGKKVQLPGCSVYEYDLNARLVTGGRIYFDLGTLMRQIGA
jgi:steroid delta-isomerase-like uncharacterized protein